MKRLSFIALLCMAFLTTSEAKPDPAASVNIDFFYSPLESYGQWINTDFGYSWRPYHVARGWRPYLYGRWAWTDYGWYWVSSEPFGWATFHYGRWVYDDYYGWIWIPDDVWGPSWVEWRYDDDYIGWAPLPPDAGFNVSVGIVFSHHWVAPMHYWSFVPCRDFTSGRVVDYVQPLERTRRIFGNTRSGAMIRTQDHRVFNGGIDVGFVEHRTNSRVTRYDVVGSDRERGDRLMQNQGRNQIQAFRPRFEGTSRGEGQRTPVQSPAGRAANVNRGNPQAFGRGRSNVGERPSPAAPAARPPESRGNVPREIQRSPGPSRTDRWQQQQARLDQMRQQQMRENRDGRNSRPPQVQQRQQQSRERPQTRQPASRGGREGRRRG